MAALLTGNLEKPKNVQKRILQVLFVKQKHHSLKDLINAYHIHVVFDLNVLEVFKELFKQIRIESPLCLLQMEREQFRETFRCSQKGLLGTAHCRTVAK